MLHDRSFRFYLLAIIRACSQLNQKHLLLCLTAVERTQLNHVQNGKLHVVLCNTYGLLVVLPLYLWNRDINELE